MRVTLTKKRKYNLLPFGKFVIKDKTRQGHLPNIIPLDELTIRHDTAMPMTAEQEEKVLKLMKKHKTDILSNNGYDFYTRAGRGLTEVWHKKLSLYKEDPAFKLLVDNGHTWGAIVLNNVK